MPPHLQPNPEFTTQELVAINGGMSPHSFRFVAFIALWLKFPRNSKRFVMFILLTMSLRHKTSARYS